MTLIGSVRRRLLREPPLDWTRGAGRPLAARPEVVDIIIPIHGAADDLARCLASVSAETDLARHELILVVDGPQDESVESVLREFSAGRANAPRLFRNERQRGFAGSVNRGMAESARDVVLLNSDTIVTARWLEKMIDAANSSGDCGSVTPLSNHATLCSVPRTFEENLLPIGFDPASFGALVDRVSTRRYPRLPTGVGLCLYIRRALIDDIGLFDDGEFGPGYGEENDFCLRALARGWLNLADDATFIYHAGHRSFGASREALQRRATALLEARHPAYVTTIAHFMALDPFAPVRASITAALTPPKTTSRPRGPRRVVHLVHGWPPFQHAGTELYAYWLVQRQLAWRDVSVYTRLADPTRRLGDAIERIDGGARVRFVTNNFTQRDPRSRNAISERVFERDFERFLRDEKPDLLHMHHLAGHAFSLPRIARRLGIPIVTQIQDWWSLCARVNFFDSAERRCSGPDLDKCSRCATLTRLPPAALLNRLLHLRRRAAARDALAVADAYVMGSRCIRDDYQRAGLLTPSTPALVIPYGVDLAVRSIARAPRERPLRFGFVGSILPHKGLHIAVEAFRSIDPTEASLHAWGNTEASASYTAKLRERAGSGVSFEGVFAEEDKQRIFDSIDVLLMPSLGLESFGLAAREAMACGVPVVATNDGALAEMFDDGADCGALFPSGDAAALEAIIRRLVADPTIVDRWTANIKPPKSAGAHAEEIEDVYEMVLARRAR